MMCKLKGRMYKGGHYDVEKVRHYHVQIIRVDG